MKYNDIVYYAYINSTPPRNNYLISHINPPSFTDDISGERMVDCL